MKHERGASGSVFVYPQFGLFVNVGVMSPNVQKSVWDLVLLAHCTIQGTIEKLHMYVMPGAAGRRHCFP